MLIALGGNVITQTGERGEIAEQFSHSVETLSILVDYIKDNPDLSLILTHGNGPQIGRILLRSELTAPEIPLLPMDTCVADSQGGMGYMLQQVFRNLLDESGIKRNVVTLMTQVEVDKNDPAFENPTKPIGKFYSKREADVLRSHGWVMMFDSGRGFRRIVASPRPVKIIEFEIIKQLLDNKCIVIAAGGGGIPVIRENDGKYHGVDAVIDKDETSVMLANQLGLKNVLIITGVDNIYRNFGREDEEPIYSLSLKEAEKLLHEGQLGTGSMAPKTRALIKFIRNGGEFARVCSPGNFRDTLYGKSGTKITN